MKHITVSLDEETYHRVRIRAALNEIAGSETEFERLRAEEQTLRLRLAARDCGFSARDRLSRDEVHDRDALR